jgi:alcohol dehydrogenase (cytochrome c)
MMRSVLVGVVAIAAASCSSGATTHDASATHSYAGADSVQRAHMVAPTQWESYGRDFTNQRWSPLAQIDTGNVAKLQPAWVFHSGIKEASESNPIVVDSVLYVSTAFNHVVALDAYSGRKKWEYVHSYRTTVDCCGPINRGVSYYDGKIFMGSADARLVALDASSGRKLWDVVVGDNLLGYHLTGAPTIVEGKVVLGVSGGEQGCRCYVDAYDAQSGKRVWRWYTIPSPQEGGWWGTWRAQDEWGQSFQRDIAREKADSARYADAWQHGGGPMWNHPAYDPETHLLFMNIGNPAPDIDGSVRPGDNLYTDCIVAVDVRTGKLKWYYQEVAHDLWDYDATTPPVLADIRDAHGRMIKTVVEAGKDGFVYVLDRATGQPIRKAGPISPLENYMQLPTKQGVIINPGTLGGNDWSPTAFSPQTGYLYTSGNYLPMKYKLKPEPLKAPAQWWSGSATGTPSGHYGIASAVDLSSGRVAWQQRIATPLLGGTLATAGGLVFLAGRMDGVFSALDARTGRELWSYKTTAGVNAPPISYEVNNTQFIAVAATGIVTNNSPRGDELLVFALPAHNPANKP